MASGALTEANPEGKGPSSLAKRQSVVRDAAATALQAENEELRQQVTEHQIELNNCDGK